MGTLREIILFCSLSFTACLADGNIGCLFCVGLCNDLEEACFDDFAFGRCVKLDVDQEELHRFDLGKEKLGILDKEMRRLETLGYGWPHPYTQCVVKGLLDSFRFSIVWDSEHCDRLDEKELQEIVEDFDQEIYPQSLAMVEFKPSAVNPHPQFADEVYFPPVIPREILNDDGYEVGDSGTLHSSVSKKAGRPVNVFQAQPAASSWRDILGLNSPFVEENSIPSSFSRHYNTPEQFRQGHEIRDQLLVPPSIPEGYTEGGVVLSGPDVDQELDDILGQLDNFKRPERLDVKKPGPAFSIHNQEGKNITPGNVGGNSDLNKNGQAEETAKPELQTSARVQKKELALPDSTSNEQYDVVDTSYAYVGFKDSVRSWLDGTKVIEAIARLLDLDPRTFSHVRVDRNEVTFKVEPNIQGLNASEVAKRIESIKGKLKDDIDVEVTSAGIGDKTKLPSVLRAEPGTDRELLVATLLVCGLLGAVLAAAAALVIIRRHARSRDKLNELSRPESEPSKDYQELCRARMASKAPQPEGGTKPEPLHVGQRVASLSRDSENSNQSPSSRSSTSSWSEEPALTNMDISTGHMVLAYMEDHLKNADRLQQEWIALCAYEAEPCATTMAQKPENLGKNRYPEFLPYDHSRVVLNELANISGSDYINASTITDHDPRNPAYIAAQGPLPHTSPDFWQLVWEQGAVVLVMLTRLTEGGTAMCHRYWPEEGSELYHIYEVHLVSEHIWCDDYLVRSFYLKNLKTGETRTVTQFHFLSWPESGVPAATRPLLEFRRKVNKSYRGRSCPIVVHCSDGVGRTGTYCLIDMVLNRMAKGAKEIDIAATLEHIRDQRPAMVRTRQQFEFVLTAVAEEVHAILKALPQQQQQSQQQQQPQQQ